MQDQTEPDPVDHRPSGPSRRTVARGIAWTAPVLTGAAVAPALAASPGQTSIDVAAICDGTSPAVWLAAGPGGSPPGETIHASQTVTTYSLNESQGATWHSSTVLPGMGLSAVLTAGPWGNHEVIAPGSSSSGLWEHSSTRSIVANPLGPNELAGSWLGDLSSIPYDEASSDGQVITYISLEQPVSENPRASTDRTRCQPPPLDPWSAWLTTTCDARGEGLAGLELQATGAPPEAVTVVFRVIVEDWSETPSAAAAAQVLTEQIMPLISLDATLATGSWSEVRPFVAPAGWAGATRELTVPIDPMPTSAPWPTLAIAGGSLPSGEFSSRVFAYITEGQGATSNNTAILSPSACT